MSAIVEWLQINVAPLVARGERCTVTLHIGQGDIKADLERRGLIVKPPYRYRPPRSGG